MTLDPISPIQSSPPKAAVQPAEQAARDTNAANAAAKASGENKEAASEAPAKVAAKAKPAVSSFSNIELKFQVDPKTQALSVLILDRTAHRLIRTIPPDELKQMQAGDLVELLS
jgi:uncharacterized FlaG/YvyC family protein